MGLTLEAASTAETVSRGNVDASPGRLLFDGYMAAIVVGSLFAGWQAVVVGQDLWRLFDWLISYDGGFVRRGLSGTIFWGLSDITGIPAPSLVFVVQAACYLTLFASGYWLVNRLRPLPWELLPLVFAPWLFAYQAHDRGAGFRKEILLLALVAVVAAWSTEHDGFRPTAAAVTAMIPIVLMHEALVAYLPYLVVAGRPWTWTRSHRIQVGALAAVVAVTTVPTLLWRGDWTHVEAICGRVVAELRPTVSTFWCDSPPDSAIGALARTAEGEFATIALGQLAHWPALVAVVILVVLGMIPAFLLARQSVPTVALRWLAAAAGAAWLMSLPLFVMGGDWGRFIYIHAASSGLLLLAFLARHRAHVVSRVLTPRAYRVLIGATVLYATCWNMRHVEWLLGSGLFN